ncbi:MAG: ketoacyl-ACP synthase III [Thermodesulfovibrionia bacterium]|nr:MAG: ketoacyl-ACP synthase III [Thermodesulfovibrionia bacterium]
MRSRITGTGSHVPKRVLTNEDLERMVNTSDKWITERTGIRERRIADSSEAASDLGAVASKRALQSAGVKPKEIDMIIVATVSGDMPVPSTASFIQSKLGIKDAAVFDVNAACTGFLYGLSVADNFIKGGNFKKILLVGTDVLSRFTDWKDRSTCILFGDAAGAAVIEATRKNRGIMSIHLHSNGNLWDLLYLPGGGSKHPPSKENIRQRMNYIKMKGNETFKIAVRTLEKLAVETLKANGIKPSDLSLLIPHQANLRILQATAKRLNLSMDKVVVNIDKYGNTSSASIPLALDEAVRTGRIRQNDYILLEAFGGGLTWGSALIKW